jgi:hypothetical protein
MPMVGKPRRLASCCSSVDRTYTSGYVIVHEESRYSRYEVLWKASSGDLTRPYAFTRHDRRPMRQGQAVRSTGVEMWSPHFATAETGEIRLLACPLWKVDSKL